jgi:hypothetical protein
MWIDVVRCSNPIEQGSCRHFERRAREEWPYMVLDGNRPFHLQYLPLLRRLYWLAVCFLAKQTRLRLKPGTELDSETRQSQSVLE